jgi:hypothetical protein
MIGDRDHDDKDLSFIKKDRVARLSSTISADVFDTNKKEF